MNSCTVMPARATNWVVRRHFLRSTMRQQNRPWLLQFEPASVEFARTPEIVRRGLARHDVPGFRLARLAVDRKLQGQGLGGQLLLAAGRRCLMASAEVGGVILVIDAKNERVAGWYASYGAMPLLDAPFSLLLPLSTIRTALKAVGNWP